MSVAPALALHHRAFSPERLSQRHAESSGLVRRTPLLSSRGIGEICGGTIALKAENLQRTGSFKLRGALSRLGEVSHVPHSPGVVAGSAGNHAQALAYAARARGLHCEGFMPRTATVSKVAAVEAFGATVVCEADSVDGCV